MILQTTLSLAAAAAILNVWIMIRVSALRVSGKVIHGDGGNAALMKRMRAHANFVENVPLALILIAAIEISAKGGLWLSVWGGVFMLARIAHAFGMDGTSANKLRMIGTIITMLTQLGLAIVAILISMGVI
mgnify:CR=1 FL=1